MTQPSNLELDCAIGLAIGLPIRQGYTSYGEPVMCLNEMPYTVWNPTVDRNLLPQIWDALEKADTEDEDRGILTDFEHSISAFARSWVHCDILAFLRVEPGHHVEAALKALGKWNSEWTTEEPEL